MNLQQLQSNLPKPWLDIQCNKLTCNEIVVPVLPSNVQLFACYQSVARPATASQKILCDTVLIANPNLNIATNVYTAPSTQFVQVTLQGVIGLGASGATITSSVTLTVNDLTQPTPTMVQSVAVGSNGLTPITCSGIVRLNAGDRLGYSVDNSVSVGQYTQFWALTGTVV